MCLHYPQYNEENATEDSDVVGHVEVARPATPVGLGGLWAVVCLAAGMTVVTPQHHGCHEGEMEKEAYPSRLGSQTDFVRKYNSSERSKFQGLGRWKRFPSVPEHAPPDRKGREYSPEARS